MTSRLNRRNRLLFLAAVVAVGTSLFAAPAGADHGGSVLHWGGTSTVTLEDRTGNSYVRDGIALTVSAFNAEKGGLRLQLAWRIGPADNECPHSFGVVTVCLPTRLDNTDFGATYGAECDYLSAHCSSGSIEGNRSELLPFTAPATFVIRHELGHILGLSHSQDFSVMNTSGNGKQTENYSTHDWTVLRQIYAHSDAGLLPLLPLLPLPSLPLPVQ